MPANASGPLIQLRCLCFEHRVGRCAGGEGVSSLLQPSWTAPEFTTQGWWMETAKKESLDTHACTHAPCTCLLQAKDKDSPQVEQLMSRMAILESEFGQDA